METVVGAVSKKNRQIFVGALIEVMAQFVVNGGEVFFVGLDAHLDPKIVHRIDVPCARMANDVTITRLYEKRPVPERFRQWSEPERRVEAFARLHHIGRAGIVSL